MSDDRCSTCGRAYAKSVTRGSFGAPGLPWCLVCDGRQKAPRSKEPKSEAFYMGTKREVAAALSGPQEAPASARESWLVWHEWDAGKVHVVRGPPATKRYVALMSDETDTALETGRMTAAAPALHRVAEALLLLHSPEPWDAAKASAWHRLTGTREVTPKALCDLARKALAAASPPASQTITCPDCYGEGYAPGVPCPRDCKACDGAGFLTKATP